MATQDLLYLYCLEQQRTSLFFLLSGARLIILVLALVLRRRRALCSIFERRSEEPTDSLYRELQSSPNLANARREAVDWILTVNSYYSFANLTAVLAVNYLDRFLLCFHLQTDKPWMTQLAAVACLSVAAKFEETHVPLLLDLQVGESSRYVFDPKTIQKMEILILSALKWRMNPVTPLSFLDYMARRLGMKMKNHLCQCERIIVSVISDSRSLLYSPSVIAASAMRALCSRRVPAKPVRNLVYLINSGWVIMGLGLGCQLSRSDDVASTVGVLTVHVSRNIKRS